MVLLSLEGNESVTHIFPSATLYPGTSCKGSRCEYSDRYLRKEFLHLCGDRRVAVYDFFATTIMGGDDPTDGGECCLGVRHDTLDERMGEQTTKDGREEFNSHIYSP